MPDWIEELLLRFCTIRRVAVDSEQLAMNFLKMEMGAGLLVEVDFIPHAEALLFSIRLTHFCDEESLSYVLRQNHFERLRPFSPTAHLFDDSIVLRSVLGRDDISLTNLDTLLNMMLATHSRIQESL